PICFCMTAISFGSVSSACFSLKLSLRFDAVATCGAEAALPACADFVFRARGDVVPPSHQHIAIAAGIFGPMSMPHRHDPRVGHAIQKIAVMADQDDG